MEDEATWRLLLARGLGRVTFAALRRAFEHDRDIVAASISQLTQAIGARRARSIRAALDEADPETERRWMQRLDAEVLVEGDVRYPALLACIPDPPVALWVRGDPAVLHDASVAIVGSRLASPGGVVQAGRFAAALASSGLTIVSGGARGIDAEAHRATLRAGGRTVVVLGCGLATAYPAEHAQLYQQIIDGGGAIVSEQACAVPPRPGLFPRRNRIISGLALGTLVIEAASRSGALITARLAAEDHGREVFALPGRVEDRAARGCLELLQKGGAALAIEPDDIVQTLRSSAAALTLGAHQAVRTEVVP